MTIRSRCPGVPVDSRQVPYPPGGPDWLVVPGGSCPSVTVKVNPVPLVVAVLRGGSCPSGGPGFPRFSRCLLWLLGSGRAQPWPMACPSWSVTVTHHVVFGFCAAALDEVAGQARVDRADPGDLAGPFAQAEQGDQRDGQVDLPGEPGRQRAGSRRCSGRPACPGLIRGPDPPCPGPSWPGRESVPSSKSR